MTLAQTYAWIFYALGLASANPKEPADHKAIESLADAINHAIPTQKEMRLSLLWLESQGLIQTENKRFQLSATGNKLLNEASASKKTITGVWKLIQQRFSEMGVDDIKQVNPRTMRAEDII